MKSILMGMMVVAGLMVAVAATAADMPLAAKKNNCTACHALEQKQVGPAWMEVARKYRGQTEFVYNGKKYPLVEGLVLKVSKGGAGNWGTAPMLANDPSGAKRPEMVELVRFILGLSG